jgi:hypothetical protein
MDPRDSLYEFALDLAAMSNEKDAAVASGKGEHDCEHPLTCHTGTEATFPWRICARKGCGCQVLME